ncbi:hypothetical protein HC823_01300 [Candidatus Gracilibacteria bacterium]|nr:hypothetical protein [Candidatus Gracilibacteria bacterium]
MKKVLVVDSVDFNRELLEESLKQHDIEVIQGIDIDAIEAELRNGVDVIISGNRLASGSGAEALMKSATKAEKCLYTTAPVEILPKGIEKTVKYFQKPDIGSLLDFVLGALKR